MTRTLILSISLVLGLGLGSLWRAGRLGPGGDLSPGTGHPHGGAPGHVHPAEGAVGSGEDGAEAAPPPHGAMSGAGEVTGTDGSTGAGSLGRPGPGDVAALQGGPLEVDLENELWGEVFDPLQDPDVFRDFRLNEELNTLTWPTGADLAPEYLYERVTARLDGAADDVPRRS